MKSPGARLPRPRVLVLVVVSTVAMVTIFALKLCNDKYQLYREFANLERLSREVTSLERNVDDLAVNVVQLDTRLEKMARLRNVTTAKTDIHQQQAHKRVS